MITVRRMLVRDLPLVLRLRAQAGWNQTRDDLNRFLILSNGGSFVAEWDGQPAGTVCTFVFGSTAWVAMVLVEESLRGRGIGTALMQHAIGYLDGIGVERIRLDATPLGRPVYEKLGFVAEYNVLRYAGDVPQLPLSRAIDARIKSPHARIEQVCQFDTAVTGADRSALLRDLCRQRAGFQMIEQDGMVEGYLGYRRGARAWQIGPCIATAATGGVLFDWAFFWTQKAPVFVDILEHNPSPIAAAEAIGLRVQRTLTRMCRGPLPAERTDMIWASSGPEKG